MDHIEFLNHGQPGYDGPWISGEERWVVVLQAYMRNHGNEITTAHSLRSRWSRAKTKMEKLIKMNKKIKLGKVRCQFLCLNEQFPDSLNRLLRSMRGRR